MYWLVKLEFGLNVPRSEFVWYVYCLPVGERFALNSCAVTLEPRMSGPF
jgi:hypothetical protein